MYSRKNTIPIALDFDYTWIIDRNICINNGRNTIRSRSSLLNITASVFFLLQVYSNLEKLCT